MRLTVVGCSGSVPGPDSPASCYVVQAPYEGRLFSLVVDLGSGAFGALYRYLDPSSVDAIAFSHLHPDHCLDLCAYAVAAGHSPTAPWPVVPIYGPRGMAERFASAYRVPGREDNSGSGIVSRFSFNTWESEQRIGPFMITTVQVDHSVESYAIKITEPDDSGGTLVYSGDTGPSEKLIKIAKDADLLLCEAGFLDLADNPQTVHLNGREAAQHAAAAQVGCLVLTHIPPWHDRDQVLAEAQGHFDGPIELASPGSEWTIGNSVSDSQ